MLCLGKCSSVSLLPFFLLAISFSSNAAGVQFEEPAAAQSGLQKSTVANRTALDEPPPPVPRPETPSIGLDGPSWASAFNTLLKDHRDIWLAPTKVEKRHLPWLLPVIGATAAMSQFDHRVAGALPNSTTQVNVGRAVSHAGTYYALGGLTASFLLAGRLSGNRRATETGLLSAAALLHTESVVQMSKWAFGRERPDYGAGKGNFLSGQQSFPSGHAAGTWAVAAVISREYYDNKLIRYGIYALPITVSAARISARRHFVSDVIAGAVIGNLIGAFIYSRHHDPSLGGAPIRERSRAIPTPGITFSPSTRTYALSLTWNP